MKELFIPAPSEKQREMLLDRHKVIGYGGARGGGKSWAVRVKAVLLCLSYPGICCMIVRKSYPELRENHIQPLLELLRCYDKDRNRRLASYNDQQKTIRFPKNWRIILMTVSISGIWNTMPLTTSFRIFVLKCMRRKAWTKKAVRGYSAVTQSECRAKECLSPSKIMQWKSLNST